jgi:probable rRNA maturation factor
VSIEFIYEIEGFSLNNTIDYSSWLCEIAKYENKEIGQIEFIFVNDPRIIEINQIYLKHFYPTDIITFDNTFLNIISGTIYISVDSVRKNAKLFSGGEFEKELNRVIVHGLLHLIGYNDKTIDETKLMREKEDFYLNILG